MDSQIEIILRNNPVSSLENVKNWLLKVITLIDLTTLSGDDTPSNVIRLCHKVSNVIINLILIISYSVIFQLILFILST